MSLNFLRKDYQEQKWEEKSVGGLFNGSTKVEVVFMKFTWAQLPGDGCVLKSILKF